MKLNEQIIDDLDKRGVRVISFICERPDGKLIFLSYDSTTGLIDNMDGPVDSIRVYTPNDNNTISPLFGISRKDGKGEW